MFPKCLEQLEYGVVIARIEEGVEYAVDLSHSSRDVCSDKKKVLERDTYHVSKRFNRRRLNFRQLAEAFDSAGCS